jgi:hypothetical protein
MGSNSKTTFPSKGIKIIISFESEAANEDAGKCQSVIARDCRWLAEAFHGLSTGVMQMRTIFRWLRHKVIKVSFSVVTIRPAVWHCRLKHGNLAELERLCVHCLEYGDVAAQPAVPLLGRAAAEEINGIFTPIRSNNL